MAQGEGSEAAGDVPPAGATGRGAGATECGAGMTDSGVGAPARAADAPAHALFARQLLRAARQGTLATQSGGQPFASLVTPATLPDGSVLLLLSGLSEHTRHLLAEPRCALMVCGAAEGPNPQTTPRVTLTGTATPLERAPQPVPSDAAVPGITGARARWVALHPYAAFYAGLGDFRLWRMVVEGGQLIGGFASAHRLGRAALQPDATAVAAVAASEPGIIGHCNADHADALARIAVRHGGAPGPWAMVAADIDGFDLCSGETVLRVPFSAPVADSRAVRAELVRLSQAA